MTLNKLVETLSSLLEDKAHVYSGYPENNSIAPYCVVRPTTSLALDRSVCGASLGWEEVFYVYCCAHSVGASYNLANFLARGLNNLHISVEVGYSGNLVGGLYESQVTVRVTRGQL